MLPDKGQQILAYCRSGRRSKLAAEILVELGFPERQELFLRMNWLPGFLRNAELTTIHLWR